MQGHRSFSDQSQMLRLHSSEPRRDFSPPLLFSFCFFIERLYLREQPVVLSECQSRSRT